MKIWHKFLDWVAGFSRRCRFAEEEAKYLRASCGGYKSANTKLRRRNHESQKNEAYIKNLERRCEIMKAQIADDEIAFAEAIAGRNLAESRLAKMVSTYQELWNDRIGKKEHPRPESIQ